MRGATEGINLVAQSWGRDNLKPGDRVLVSALEHHSNIVPWQLAGAGAGRGAADGGPSHRSRRDGAR